MDGTYVESSWNSWTKSVSLYSGYINTTGQTNLPSSPKWTLRRKASGKLGSKSFRSKEADSRMNIIKKIKYNYRNKLERIISRKQVFELHKHIFLLWGLLFYLFIFFKINITADFNKTKTHGRKRVWDQRVTSSFYLDFSVLYGLK